MTNKSTIKKAASTTKVTIIKGKGVSDIRYSIRDTANLASDETPTNVTFVAN
jgi:hypothetical protein